MSLAGYNLKLRTVLSEGIFLFKTESHPFTLGCLAVLLIFYYFSFFCLLPQEGQQEAVLSVPGIVPVSEPAGGFGVHGEAGSMSSA